MEHSTLVATPPRPKEPLIFQVPQQIAWLGSTSDFRQRPRHGSLPSAPKAPRIAASVSWTARRGYSIRSPPSPSPFSPFFPAITTTTSMTTMLKVNSSSSLDSTASGSGSGSRLHPDDRLRHSHGGRARKHSSASSRSYSPYPLTPPQSIRDAYSPAAPSQRWDDDMPNAPAPLSDILRAFRESGDGDREMLLAILNAKRAEEERITTLMQTRLALLHAHAQSTSPRAVAGPSILHSPYPGHGTGAAPIPIPRREREFGSGSSSSAGSAHGLELLLNAGRVRESDERSR